jgi:hypothetical protein
MADVTITAANVVPGANARTVQGVGGATITAGQVVYQEAATGKWKLADADSATAEVRQAKGIALTGCANNQPIVVQTDGDLTIGGTLTAGAAYYLSGTAGGICPVADVGAGEYVCLLGLAKSTSVLAMNIQYPGVSL